MLEYLEKVTLKPSEVTADDAARLYAAGVSKQAAQDALYVSFVFNIHDRMAGFIHVVNTPHFAITRKDGVATLDVPAGEHTLQVGHAQMGDKQLPQRQAIKVQASGGTVVIRLGAASKP